MYVSSLDSHNHFTVFFFCIKILCWAWESISVGKVLKASQAWGPEFFCHGSHDKLHDKIHATKRSWWSKLITPAIQKLTQTGGSFFWISGQAFYPKWWDVGHLMTLSQKEVGIISEDDNQSCLPHRTRAHTHTCTNMCTCTEASKNTHFKKAIILHSPN